MQEQLDLVIQHTRMVWRFRWVALVLAAVVAASGWVAVLMMPDQYGVSAKVFLDTRSLLRPVLKGLAVDAATDLDTALLMRRTLLVRPNLEAVARKTDLDLTAETPQQFEALLNRLANKITVTGTRRDNIFVISYSSDDAEVAKSVVDALLQIFVEKSLGDTRKDTSKTRQFVERQIAEYEARLLSAEERLEDFKRRNVGLMPQSGSSYFMRLSQLRGQIDGAQLELQEARRRAAQVREQLGSVSETLVAGAPVMPGQVDPRAERVRALQESLDLLLLNYTEKHPDVVSTRRVLAEAIEDLENAPTEQAEGPQSEALRAQNPVYLELTVQLSQAQGEVAALEARVAEYERREEELKGLVDTVPQVEAELARLDRDYAINKKHYEELVQRREGLKLADEAGQTTDKVRFNIIEPPRVPLLPDGPDRALYSTMALGAGLGAGVGLALLIALIRPAVYARESFAEFTDLPVIGTVNRILTPRERLRRRLEIGTFATACVGLFVAFGGLLLVYQLGIDLQDQLVGLARRVL